MLIVTTPSAIEGHRKCPRSNRFVNRHAPRPSCQMVEAKQLHQKLLADIEFANSGLVQLRANLEQKKCDLDVLTARTIDTLEPIIIDEGEQLADEVLRLESLASVARARLNAFAKSGQGGHVQRLGRHERLRHQIFRVQNWTAMRATYSESRTFS
jgi:predicted methyltransferase MtxX (methanogen marker protein 4)